MARYAPGTLRTLPDCNSGVWFTLKAEVVDFIGRVAGIRPHQPSPSGRSASSRDNVNAARPGVPTRAWLGTVQGKSQGGAGPLCALEYQIGYPDEIIWGE
jgi:hypothetical protein